MQSSEIFSEMFYGGNKKQKRKYVPEKNIMWGSTHLELGDVENWGEKFMCKRLYSKKVKIGIFKKLQG